MTEEKRKETDFFSSTEINKRLDDRNGGGEEFITEEDEIIIPGEDEKERIFLMKLHLYVFESSKFPLHLRHLLENNNIETIGDLVQKSEQDLLKIPQFGRGRLHYVNITLEGIGLSLRVEETDEERYYRRYKEKWEKRNK